jgi:hypothetical protein
MGILLDLGYTSGEIKGLCIYNMLIYTPKNNVIKLFSLPKKLMQKSIVYGGFLPALRSKFKK